MITKTEKITDPQERTVKEYHFVKAEDHVEDFVMRKWLAYDRTMEMWTDNGFPDRWAQFEIMIRFAYGVCVAYLDDLQRRIIGEAEKYS